MYYWHLHNITEQNEYIVSKTFIFGRNPTEIINSCMRNICYYIRYNIAKSLIPCILYLTRRTLKKKKE